MLNTAETLTRHKMNDSSGSSIGFRQMTKEDFDLFYNWLNDPLLVDVWLLGKEPNYEEIGKKYLPRIEGKTPVSCFIITLGDRPVGYIQAYLWKDFPEDSSILTPEERNAASFDIFIGSIDHRGKSLGHTIVSRFLDEVVFRRYRVDLCVEAPLLANQRSIRTLEKAGFTKVRTAKFPNEPGPSAIMVYRADP